MTKTLYVHEIHQQHREWNSVLDLAQDEILSFENRLGEIVNANTGKEVLAQAEHFQNLFIRHKEVTDELRHDIHEDELRIAENAKSNNVALEHRKTGENALLKQRVLDFQKIFDEMKSEYLRFLSKIF